MQYAHLCAAYLETDVIKSHDLELRQDCWGIIPHHSPPKMHETTSSKDPGG